MRAKIACRRYGWGFKSSRVVRHVPFGHWKTCTFVASFRVTGLTAPLVTDGPMTGEILLAYTEQFLLPTLRPGDVMVMDNLSSHKQQGVRELIESVGAHLLYLPPYSPDLNPIELAFSKLKCLLCKSAERTVSDLWRRIGLLLNDFTPHECRNYFEHCGYHAD